MGQSLSTHLAYWYSMLMSAIAFSSAPFNFNGLQDEIQHLILSMLDPYERASICSTCKRWNEIINETNSYWREVDIKQHSTLEEAKTRLQVFGSKSQNSLREIKVATFIKTEEELQAIFSLIQPSSSTIVFLALRQIPSLNTQTRKLSRGLPNLKFLFSTECEEMVELKRDCTARTSSNLREYQTDILEDFEDQDAQLLSQLQHLKIQTISSADIALSILRRCRSSLQSCTLQEISSSGESTLSEAIEMEALDNLNLPDRSRYPGSLVFPLNAPVLKLLNGALCSVKAVNASSLLHLSLMLENEGEGGWDQRETEEFAVGFKHLLSHNSPPILQVAAVASNCESQLQAIIQALHWTENPGQHLLCPGLQHLTVMTLGQDIEMEPLAKMAISRDKYNFLVRGGIRFNVSYQDLKDPNGFKRFNATRRRFERERIGNWS